MTLSEQIAHAIAIKAGDKEFALFYSPDCGWSVDMGNTSPVSLGECVGEVFADGKTPEAAMAALIAKLEAA